VKQELNESRYKLLKKETKIDKLKRVVNEKTKLAINLQQHINIESKQERNIKEALYSVLNNKHIE
jgi:hypothetical protein